MTRPAKVLTIIAITLLAIPVGCGLLLAGSIVTSGIVTVKVHETKPGGSNVFVPVPAGLIYLGMDILPLLDRNHGMEKARKQMGAMAPVAVATMQALEDCPDAVLVDVKDHNETVKIVKSGRNIEIHVHDADGQDVHITLPAHLFTRVARQLV